ncbi:Signal transduction histidine kinase [Clostridium cavendishii DSM 21758]|uniref:histidine kinase n=1 Tax=Clostridium cavendishii DSM 21758 TaxID=1121302 RepID=A0A1M6I4X6_9CLOT|nr:sensor histidine kinase [Clostridium cavendishii]SHJ29434.1 Signal transduction histidine kinase [Clostridium cavendishii DSM 21758]
MNLFRFIKETKLNILSFISIFLVTNIYLFSLNSFKERIEDILYIDFIVAIIYFGIYIIEYSRWTKKYKQLYELVLNKKDIKEEDVRDICLEQEIIRNVIINKDKIYMDKCANYEEALKDMEEYISKWVHEIKLPISALNIVNDRVSDIEQNKSIKNEVEKINFLVNSVMYGSRTTASSEDIFIKLENIEEIIKKAIKNSAFFLIKNNIEVNLKNLNYNVYTDSKWMTYVVEQIINNAIKYSKENGKIEYYCIEDKDFIMLVIKDYGIGIEREDLERIFDKGFTGSNGRNKIYKSTGMGLYFVKKIINKLEHKIEVDSEKDKYTEFKIYFYKISDYLKVTKM